MKYVCENCLYLLAGECMLHEFDIVHPDISFCDDFEYTPSAVEPDDNFIFAFVREEQEAILQEIENEPPLF